MITLKINKATTQDYYIKTIIVQCMKLKLKMSMNILAAIKKCLILVIIQPSQKYYYDLHKLFIGKTKDETGDAAIEEFVRLKPKMYQLFVDGNIERKKAKSVIRSVFEKINSQ